MSEGTEHFLSSLYVHNAFSVRGLEIPIANGGQRRHLLLTGPNGSGKSAILTGLHAELRGHPSSRATEWRHIEASVGQVAATIRQLPADQPRPDDLNRSLAQLLERRNALEAHSIVEARGLPATIDPNKTILALLPATRTLNLVRPQGPTRIDESQFLRRSGAASQLLQFLVNLRTEQAYAREDGDHVTADRIGRRFEQFEIRLQEILDDEEASLSFDRASFDFSIEMGDRRSVAFDKLPDGISSILFMWASLMIPAEAIIRSGVSDPAGWVLIDEPELHLHARLQEMVLPFLTTMFPHLQFIVATHSPAILASIPDATIFDLRSKEFIDSAELRGVRYGAILTEHFGIETDFDLETTRKLSRLKDLIEGDHAPGTAEFEQMRALAGELSSVPHLLVKQVSKHLDLDVA